MCIRDSTSTMALMAAGGDNSAASSNGLINHYLDDFIGCGIDCEEAVRKVYCGGIINKLLLLCRNACMGGQGEVPLMRIGFLLVHPWTMADFTHLDRTLLNSFLRICLRRASCINDHYGSDEDGTAAEELQQHCDADFGILDSEDSKIVFANSIHSPFVDVPIVFADGLFGLQFDALSRNSRTSDLCLTSVRSWNVLNTSKTTDLEGIYGGKSDDDRRQDAKDDAMALFRAKASSTNVTASLPEIYYFEVAIEVVSTNPAVQTSSSSSASSAPFSVSIGLASKPIAVVGNHRDVGNRTPLACAVSNTGFFDSKQITSPYGSGDTIGCGIFSISKQVFFTRNGKLIGVVGEYKGGHEAYPCIDITSSGTCNLCVNFGTQAPFRFDYTTLLRSSNISTYTNKVVRDMSLLTFGYLSKHIVGLLLLHNQTTNTTTKNTGSVIVMNVLKNIVSMLKNVVCGFVPFGEISGSSAMAAFHEDEDKEAATTIDATVASPTNSSSTTTTSEQEPTVVDSDVTTHGNLTAVLQLLSVLVRHLVPPTSSSSSEISPEYSTTTASVWRTITTNILEAVVQCMLTCLLYTSPSPRDS
eukprot:TRINITY_DN5933_c0_g4_i1.p1 TRINITY_DN5933_c0_g4~~TRINITY_DN5933_c0_g4_i1.p1  ORF type:complete len:585 (-),score=87.97 TRINITY_DN5933_c0_g4_i1:131-1885(-)